MKEVLEDKELTQEESLQLIARVIGKARAEYIDTGISALLWGSVITFCALVMFFNHYWQIAGMESVWALTILAVIPQVVISIRERRARQHRRYEDDMMGGIWISFGIAMFMMSYLRTRYNFGMGVDISLVFYGIPTFATGFARGFKPMIVGGLACWVFAILSGFTPGHFQLLYIIAGAQLAWFIPGLILQRRYLKAKRKNV